MPEFLFGPISHEEAVEFIKSKPVVSRAVFDQLLPELQARAFTIAGIEPASVLQNARDLVATLPAGQPWDKVKKDLATLISPYLKDDESALAKAELLLRVHGHQAYAAASDAVMRRQTAVFPLWQYQTMGDSKVRATHRALDGLILPANSPFWKTHDPPWEWGCRCIKIPLSEDEALEIAARAPEVAAGNSDLMPVGDRLRRLEQENVIERFDLARGTREFVDVSPQRAFRFDPEDLRINVDELKARYDAPTWNAFESWARKTKLSDQGATVWDWVNGGDATIPPPVVGRVSRRGGEQLQPHPEPTPLEKKERQIMLHKTESAHLFTTDGELVFSQRGTRSQVAFDPEQVRAMKDGVLTHNHPQGSSLSYADVHLAFTADLAELRAIGRAASGQDFLYSLQRPAGGWAIDDLPEIVARYKTILFTVQTELRAAIADGRMTMAQARTEGIHTVMQRLKERYPEAINYERREII